MNNENNEHPIITVCPLCGDKGLHVLSKDNRQTMQCLSCGYASSDNFLGSKENLPSFQALTDDMKEWSKEALGRVWIPTMMTLPFGVLYPLDKDGEMKWGMAEMVDVPEEERKDYPDGKGGFYEKKYDTDNAKIFDDFLLAMNELNEKLKQNQPKQTELKLPKLKKVDN